MPDLLAPPVQPFAALSVPFATDYRELSVVLAGANLNSTPRQTIQFLQPVQIVGFFGQIARYSFTTPTPFAVPTIEDVLVQIDLDDKSTFTSQENNQIIPGHWVTLTSQVISALVLRGIQPRNRTPVIGLSFRWKVPPTAAGGTQIFEDAFISFGAYVNYPEGR